MIYRGTATKHRKQKLEDIAGPVYKLAKFVCDCEKGVREQGGRACQMNSKVQALVSMNDYFIYVIGWQEGE